MEATDAEGAAEGAGLGFKTERGQGGEGAEEEERASEGDREEGEGEGEAEVPGAAAGTAAAAAAAAARCFLPSKWRVNDSTSVRWRTSWQMAQVAHCCPPRLLLGREKRKGMRCSWGSASAVADCCRCGCCGCCGMTEHRGSGSRDGGMCGVRYGPLDAREVVCVQCTGPTGSRQLHRDWNERESAAVQRRVDVRTWVQAGEERLGRPSRGRRSECAQARDGWRAARGRMEGGQVGDGEADPTVQD